MTDEDRKLLLRVSRLLEEILETLEITSDRESVEAIREAEEDVKGEKNSGSWTMLEASERRSPRSSAWPEFS